MPNASANRVRSEVSQFYLQMLFDGKTEFMSSFQEGEAAEETVIYDPHFGEIRGLSAISQYYDHCRAWLLAENAVVELKGEWCHKRDSSGSTCAAEFVLYLDRGENIPIPVLLVRQVTRGGQAAVVSLRVYYSKWPILGKHCWRKPFLPEKDIELTGIVDRYVKGLAAGNMEEILNSFDLEHAVIQQATGTVAQGEESLIAFYSSFFRLADGGASMHYCSIIDDEHCCALEYFIDRVGKKNCLPQAGAVVYERSPEKDQLIAVRLYDDFDPFLQICLE